MTAFLSVILAFMNFLPIPALDGGYILFLLVEMITRRKPSDKFLEKANEIGFYLLLALLLFANGNDIFKIFF
jgi:regulator of sigma E protease